MQQNNKLLIKDWSIIYKFNDTQEYLSFQDLRNLSFVCKDIYYKTKSLFESHFYINSRLIIDNLSNKAYEYDIDNVEISNDMLLRFRESVKPISGLVKSAKIGEIPLYPEFQLYLDSFINLEKLYFCSSETKVNLTSLNLILTSSRKLKELRLFYIIIYSNEIGDANKVLFPPTLTKLSINWCVWPDYYQTLREDLITVPTLGPYSVLSTQKFPQLLYFEYSFEIFNSSFNPIASVLENSPKLLTINLDVRFLNQETFKLIVKSTNLKSIIFSKSTPYIFKPECYKGHSYVAITHISFKFSDLGTETLLDIELLLAHFPNLISLCLSFERPFLPQFKRILKNLQKLKHFSLTNSIEDANPLSMQLTNNTITNLNLLNFKFSQIDFKDFESWSALKTIKLEFDENFIQANDYTWQSDFIKIAVGHDWRVFSYPNFIKFYRQ
ncbi:hypothetical protein CONCODRAFT_9348 [Conidiobolus coronatus NRRL 28638]|uniref:F-box domain-containing protein n=1 Tax=Conidiobolus coronatus (strain ATCC 28846 / CBS 209.66 / NRRL 28638) TaxID=796925 RepID=A0A137P0B9_CONC2|nr:hypothetical protein CONCODRAFT_9348 [Conidiobolus coronatus NRRL 28638]|eukprot:KXN68418.1 hypothetical protein CONCODRAFT_9348 [Conidiobolus coronatus NRRL 28638]